MEIHFFYAQDGNHKGPYSIAQLKEQSISPDTKVWHAGLSDWMNASEVEELKVLFQEEEPPTMEYGTIPPPIPEVEQERREEKTNEFRYPPRTYLAGAIITMIFCCFPIGLISFIYAIRVENLFYSGNYEGAIRSSRNARTWMLIALFTSLLGILIFSVSPFVFLILNDFFPSNLF
ncbi:MAG: CD225/dispanin family protein [Mangrovibacterium sp.]